MNPSTQITTRLLSGHSFLHRRLSSAVSPPPASTQYTRKHEVYLKVSKVGHTGQKVTDVLNQLTQNGVNLHKSDLLFCFHKLRQHRRFNHCFEILNWMKSGRVGSVQYRDHLNLIYHTEGVEKAEEYFNSLPLAAKKPALYECLLNCYCSNLMIVKALSLFEKMDEMNYAFRESTFNSLMGLYIKVDLPEKVPLIIQEMKQRNIPLSRFSYLNWIHSYGLLKNTEGLEKVMDEVKRQTSLMGDWELYDTLASAFIKIGQSERVAAALKKMEEILDKKDYVVRVAYHKLISLYGNNGDLESVFRAWDKLKSRFKDCHNSSFCIMLQALSKLGDIEGLRKCFMDWQSRYKSYDVRLINIVIKAYLKHELVEEAEMLLKDSLGKTRENNQTPWCLHISFMEYYLRKQDIGPAIEHVTEAIAEGWKPDKEKLDLFFERFKEEKDVCGAERLCNALNKAKHMDSRAYLWLLQIYAAADKTEPTPRQRMEKYQTIISTEHGEYSLECSSDEDETWHGRGSW